MTSDETTVTRLAAAQERVATMGCVRMLWGARRPCDEYDDGRELCPPCDLRVALRSGSGIATGKAPSECACWCHTNPEKCATVPWHLHHGPAPTSGDAHRPLREALTAFVNSNWRTAEWSANWRENFVDDLRAALAAPPSPVGLDE